MTRRIIALFAICLGLGSFTVARAADDAKALFAQKCAVCHGADGKGSPIGKKMGAPDLTKLASVSEADVAKAISDGKPPKMASYKSSLSAAQIDSLAKYVKTGLSAGLK